MYKVIKNLITIDECNQIYNDFISSQIKKDIQVKNSDIIYDSAIAKKHLNFFRPIVEEFFNKKVKGVRAYIRKSYYDNKLQKHKDTTQYVISVFIKQDGEGINPLYIYLDDKRHDIILNEGDAVLFCGSKFEHERPKIVSNYIMGMYLGYEEDDIKLII